MYSKLLYAQLDFVDDLFDDHVCLLRCAMYSIRGALICYRLNMYDRMCDKN